MRYNVFLDQQALDDLRRLRAYDRSKVLDKIEGMLALDPTRVSKSRIKRLRRLESPQFRLRVDDIRVFYDVEKERVNILRVLAKSEVLRYLKEVGYEPESR